MTRGIKLEIELTRHSINDNVLRIGSHKYFNPTEASIKRIHRYCSDHWVSSNCPGGGWWYLVQRG